METMERLNNGKYDAGEFEKYLESKGVKYDDETFDIKWPLEISVISEKDKSFEKYHE